ncbi:MAG TPA: universal stress protein [Vicinamibacterales bacterium]|jgi:nucleotide-binding universal stress UspA family protein
MITINRVLCPIDFAASSAEVLASAAAIARYHGAKLTVLHVAGGYPVPAGPTPGRRQPARAFWLQRLREITADLREAQEGVAVAVREGEPVRRILEEASIGRADLIVMGTQGRSGLNRLLLGSVAEAVLRRASCPVLTVPPASLERALPVRGGLFSRILCPVDFSEASLAALDYGLTLAQEAQGHLTLLYVFEETHAASADHSWLARAGFHNDLMRLVPDDAHDWCAVRTLVGVGEAGDEILRVALDEEVDLIAIGAPRSSGRGWGLDSTSGRVIREAPCPVITLRAPVAARVPAAVRAEVATVG